MTSKTRWRRALAAAVGGVLIATAAACGVPSSGNPIVDGAVNPNGSPGGSGQSVGPRPPGAFSASSKPADFVQGYLAALGAMPPTATTDDEIAAAQAWIKPSCQSKLPCDRWHPSGPITVIRAPVDDWTTTVSGPDYKVSGAAQIIGTFSVATGLLTPSPPAKLQLDFAVRADPASGSGYWRLEKAPPYLLLSEDAMSTWYTAHAVYFWNADHTALIPDIHYLSSTLGNPGSLREATQIIEWVLEGDSSPWLAVSSGDIAPGVVLKDPTVKIAGSNTNRFVVNLSANARGLDRADLLASQLRWSLGDITATPRGSWPSDVELQVDGQELTTSEFNNYRNDAVNLKPSRAYPAAASFGIMATTATSGGSVTEFEVGQTNPPVVQQVAKQSQPAVLNSPKNSGVLLAAVDGTRTAAALVRRTAPGGPEELWVRWLKAGTPTDFQLVQGLPPNGALLRPQFIVQPQSDQTTTAVCVVSVAGKLYTVSPGSTLVAQPIGSNVGAISAFSIAPDAHRIAYISGGKLYVSMLNPGGAGWTLAQGNEINTARGGRQIPDRPDVGFDTVTQVVWSSVSTLLVAGRRGQRSVVEQMSVDGSSAYDFDKDYGTSAIQQLAWYVYDPMRPAPTGYNSLLIQRVGNPGETGSSANPVTLQIVVANHVVNLYSPFFQD